MSSPASPTIYLHSPAFFPDRHRAFILEISRRFKLIVPKNSNFEYSPHADIEFAEDLIGEMSSEALQRRFQAGKDALLDYANILYGELARGLGIGSPFESSLNELEDRLRFAFNAAEVFKRAVSRRKIDLVLLSAEYGVASRAIRIEAARRKIACMNIEHGHYVFVATPDLVKDQHDIWAHFTSDFVVLDNHYQTTLMEKFYDLYNHDRRYASPKFLPLGTPIDANGAPPIDPDVAARTLGIDRSKYVVTVMGLWVEPRELLAAFQLQLDEGEYYERVFAAAARCGDRKDIHVIVKMHPALGQFPEEGDHEFFRRLAIKYGVDGLSILTTHLPEVLAVSDVVLFSSVSSVMQDCVLIGKPSAMLIPQSWDYYYHTEKFQQAQEIGRLEQLSFLRTDNDIEQFIGRYRSAESRSQFRAKNQEFLEICEMRESSAAEKSRKIGDWIAAEFGGRGRLEDRVG